MTLPAAALDASEILLGLNNGPGLYIAPPGTAGPTDLETAWGAEWLAVGYISDDGVTLGASTESDDLTPWQSTSPVRTIITGKSLTLQFAAWQTTPLMLGVFFDVEPPTEALGVSTFDIRSDGGGILYAVGLDVKDGDNAFRVVFPRAQLSDNGDVTISRGSAIPWDVTLSALDDNGVLAHMIVGSISGGATGLVGPDGQPVATTQPVVNPPAVPAAPVAPAATTKAA